MSDEASSIKPLPDLVKNRLRSTLNITSLSDAISELIQNSLDAAAKNIKVQVNLSRNSCVVEDDGAGIFPGDLGSIGGMNATSKYPPLPHTSLFGIRGEALASLATHSLLTLTTRHCSYRSTHTVRFSYSKRIFAGPAPEHQRLLSHGTIVRIEGLWGDMPVRLKARRLEDMEREWEDVIRVVVELLLTPRGKDVSAVVRDENGIRKLNVKGGRSSDLWEAEVLDQVYGKEINKSGWERVQAKQGNVRIEGLISTHGTGSKAHQYLFVNNHPLPPATTLLHSEINRILNASTFGVIEDENLKHKQNESTTLRVRNTMKKGVDKYGMFVLRIQSSKAEFQVLGGEGGTVGKSGVEGENLKAIIDLLQKLIHQFLKTHHFHPNALSTASKKDDERSHSSTHSIIKHLERQCERSRSSTPSSNEDTAPNPITVAKGICGDFSALGDLGAWSKVKSAKIDTVEEAGRCIMDSGTASPYGKVEKNRSNEFVKAASVGERSDEKENEVLGDGDDIASWKDPVSRKAYEVNARTGNTTSTKMNNPPLTGIKRPIPAFSGERSLMEGGNNAKKPRRSEGTGINYKEPGQWVEDLLKTWKNPVFHPTEASIPQIPLQTTTAGPSSSLHHHHCGYDTEYLDLSREATSQRLGRLTKEGLRNAHVIAQVDRKYILIKMQGLFKEVDEHSNTDDKQPKNDNELLVIVDQHAADERVRVEKFFRGLCTTSSDNDIPVDFTQSDPPRKELTFKISSRDGELLLKYRYAFEEWGIGYEVIREEEDTLRIKTLPKVVAERCENEPMLAIDMIRKHIYDLHEKGANFRAHTNSEDGEAWVRRIRRCPKALVEIINSRACRSAIMFNDPLTIEECQILILKLGECKFPFQCAHGRPSMVPLVDLRIPDSLGPLGMDSGDGLAVEGRGFKEAFVKWRRK